MLRKLLIAVCCLGAAHAAPSTTPTDDIEKFLADRGVLSQMEQFRQRMKAFAIDKLDKILEKI